MRFPFSWEMPLRHWVSDVSGDLMRLLFKGRNAQPRLPLACELNCFMLMGCKDTLPAANNTGVGLMKFAGVEKQRTVYSVCAITAASAVMSRESAM